MPSSSPLGPRDVWLLQSRVPSQGQTHRAHRLRLSTYDPALLLTLPLEKLPSATTYGFISVTFLFKILEENLKQFIRQPLKDCHGSGYLQETKLHWGQLCVEGFAFPSLSLLVKMVQFGILWNCWTQPFLITCCWVYNGCIWCKYVNVVSNRPNTE